MKILTLAFPAKFQVHARFALCLLQVTEELRKIQPEWKIQHKMMLGKSNLAHGRSVLVTEWYDDPQIQDEDGFFFLDTDHTFTTEDILRVIAQEGDLNCGVYINYHKDPTSIPIQGFTEQADNIPLLTAATGFLFFRKKALTRIHTWMREVEGIDRVVINDIPDHVESRTVPFFRDIVEPIENGRLFWRGEDTSFSLRAIHAGLKIRGCITHTLGHEIPYVMFNTRPRRDPIEWPSDSVVIYCGAKEPPIILCKDRQCTVFSKHTEKEDPIIYKRYEEFHPGDRFSTIMLWGSDTIDLLNGIGPAERIILYCDTKLTQFSNRILEVKEMICPTEDIANHYRSLPFLEKITISNFIEF